MKPSYRPVPPVRLTHPESSQDAVIYATPTRGSHETLHHGNYTEYMTGKTAELNIDTQLDLEPWGYRIFVK